MHIFLARKLRKIGRVITIFVVIFGWVFSAWPPIDIGINFPPEIERAQAAENVFRVSEYYLSTGDFTGTTYDLTLDQDLASDYFVLIRGSKVDDGGSNPDNDYARVYEVPSAAGEMGDSGSTNVIALSRHVADYNWEGVVTVVECLRDCDVNGFQMVDIVQTSIGASSTSGTDASTAWTDINQVVLFGGFHGGGVEWEENTGAAQDGNAGQTRLYPSATNTINWTRDTSNSLDAVTLTTFVIEWGSAWTVQHVDVSGGNNGNGCDAVGEYNTGTINSVVRDNTWVWGTGISNGYGIGDSASGALVTLGDGVNQNTNETLVSWCGEYAHTRHFDIYAMTHPNLAVDYRFKADGDTNVLDIPVTVDSATAGQRFGWVTNSCNGSGNAHPRDRFWARYTAADEITISRGYDGQDIPAWVEGINFNAIISGSNTSQLHFRWRDDSTALNTDGGWLAAEDSNGISDGIKGQTYRLRVEVANDNGLENESAARTYELQYGRGTNCANISTWTGMSDADDAFNMVDSSNITSDGQSTSALLSNSETYTFVAGEARDTADTTGSIGPLNIDYYTELEFSFQPTELAVTGRNYCFRVYDTTADQELTTYSLYPQMTIAYQNISYSNTIMEWGTQASVGDDAWTTVNFSGTYDSPVFVCTTEYNANIGNESDGTADSIVCRVQNVGATSAQVRLQESGTLVGDVGNLTDETIHWMVVEEGAYDTGDIKMEAFTFNSTVTDGKTNGWSGQSQTLTQSYTNPVVVGQVMTTNDTGHSQFWAHDGSSGPPTSASFFAGKHISEDNDLTRADETIGVIVIEQANDTLGSIAYEARLQTQSIERIDDPHTSYTFNTAFSSTPAVGIISLAGVSGTDGPYTTLYGATPLTTTNIYPVIMETEIVDTEQSGNTEYVPYIVFESVGVYEVSSSVAVDQIVYRFYQNTDNIQPSTPLAAENTSISNVSNGTVLRIRMALQVGGALEADSVSLKLQYGQGSTCSSILTWNDVGALDSGTVWRGYNNQTPADGASITSSLLINQSNVLQSYEEVNNSVGIPTAMAIGEEGEWDWVVQNNGASSGAEYCFRLVKASDSSPIYYTNYPKVTTASSISISLNTDGSIALGNVALNSSQDTTPAGINDVEVVSIDNGPVDLDIKSTVFSEGGNNWSLGSSNGSDQVQWAYSSSTSPWYTISTADTLYAFDYNVDGSATRNIYFKITMPTDTTSFNQYSADVTIVASAP